MDVLTEDYNGQLMVPANFRVVAFHNEAGQVVNNTTTIPNLQILRGMGNMDAATAACRPFGGEYQICHC